MKHVQLLHAPWQTNSSQATHTWYFQKHTRSMWARCGTCGIGCFQYLDATGTKKRSAAFANSSGPSLCLGPIAVLPELLPNSQQQIDASSDACSDACSATSVSIRHRCQPNLIHSNWIQASPVWYILSVSIIRWTTVCAQIPLSHLPIHIIPSYPLPFLPPYVSIIVLNNPSTIPSLSIIQWLVQSFCPISFYFIPSVHWICYVRNQVSGSSK